MKNYIRFSQQTGKLHPCTLALFGLILLISLTSSNQHIQIPKSLDSMLVSQEAQMDPSISFPKNQGTPHATIEIISNFNFTLPNGVVSGSGTSIDPYVIANWEVDGISISSTTSFFLIQNCTISSGTGISLYNVSNGILDNNTCIFNDAPGVMVQDSSHIQITNNYCSLSVFNVVEDHEVDGIRCWTCDNFLIEDNTFFNNSGRGLFILYSFNFTVRENIMSYNGWSGFVTQEITNSSISHNYLHHNQIDGIRLSPSFNTTYSNNNCSYNGGCGILTYNSEYNLILENNCSFNANNGIGLAFDSINNDIISNLLIGNAYTCIGDPNPLLNNYVDNECYWSIDDYIADSTPTTTDDSTATTTDDSTATTTDDPTPTSTDDSSTPLDDKIPSKNLLNTLGWFGIPLILILLLAMIKLMKPRSQIKFKVDEEDSLDDTMLYFPPDEKNKSEDSAAVKKYKKKRIKFKKVKKFREEKDSDDNIDFESYL